MIRALEGAARATIQFWRSLSLDARVVLAIGMFNWLLLFANHTTVADTRDVPLWRLFPQGLDTVFLASTGALAILYAVRDRRSGPRFTARQRAVHLAAIVAAFVIAPTIASILLRLGGKPYTYIHDGALMIEEAARKLLAGHNPYVTDYLDTPLYYWPMVNNPALYHLTYFPFLFLITVPFVFVFDKIGLFWDERFLYLPAYIATLALVPLLVKRTDHKLALVALVGLNPQLFPFVVEGAATTSSCCSSCSPASRSCSASTEPWHRSRSRPRPRRSCTRCSCCRSSSSTSSRRRSPRRWGRPSGLCVRSSRPRSFSS